ncbi:MAG: hypothetical protein LBK06_10540, partial [Planctomycetaceae bacterium]|nr:hypothetical protein [Planctomycetaceae bacterium]
MYKISIAIIFTVFFQIVNTCSADNPSDASFDRNRYAQEQHNRQPNNPPNNPNLSSVTFGTVDTDNIDAPDTIREPLLLPSPPKPVVNDKKKGQLNALKNSIDAAAKPAQPYAPPNNNPTTTANYTRSKTTPTPITLAAAHTTNQPVNPPNTQPANPPTLSETLPDSAPDPLANSSHDNLDNSDNLNLEPNQTERETDSILDQKISFGKDDNKKSDNKLK